MKIVKTTVWYLIPTIVVAFCSASYGVNLALGNVVAALAWLLATFAWGWPAYINARDLRIFNRMLDERLEAAEAALEAAGLGLDTQETKK